MAQHWALLIGINRYLHLDPQWYLHGCVNDVEAMVSILRDRFGFAQDHLFLLKDEQATRSGILDALDRLAGSPHCQGLVGQDDVVVIYYSGHGSQVQDLHGDEADGLDETIVPYDSRDPAGRIRDITDDEIYTYLLRLNAKTPFVTFIADCCHSGSITRDLFGEQARRIPIDKRPFHPAEIETAVHSKGVKDAGPSGLLPLSDRYVLLAACRDNELAFELTVLDSHNQQHIRHGALTYFLCQSLYHALTGATYRDVFEKLARQVNSRFPIQTPQLEGACDRQIFGVSVSAPEPFVLVQNRSANSVTLKVGAVHGATPGSVWHIHIAGVLHPTIDTHVGTVQIETVAVLTSQSRVTQEIKPGSIQPGSRAFEVQHEFPDRHIYVDIIDSSYLGNETTTLRQSVAESRLLSLPSSEANVPDLRVYLVPPRDKLTPKSPVPQLGLLTASTWAVVDRAGQIIMLPQTAETAQAVDILVENLELYARYQRALEICHSNPAHALRDKIIVRLRRLGDNGTWHPAQSTLAGGYVEYTEGERMVIELESRATIPLYVTVLDFGLAGAISQVYPPRGASDALAPGIVLRIGERIGDELVVGMPKQFPKHRSDGIEYLKVLLTTEPSDFGVLLQPGFREVKKSNSLLAHLFSDALAGYRDLRRFSTPSDDDWTTVEIPLLIKRHPMASVLS